MGMETTDRTDDRAVLRDPEMLARLERNLRIAGMPRRRFLAMASAVAGTAALAACGGSSSPTATSAPAATATKPPAAAPTTAAPAATTAPTAAAASAPAATAPAASVAATAAPAATAPATAAASSAAAPTTAAATGPESKKVLIGWSVPEPVDNDFNRDTYNDGRIEHVSGLLRYDQDFQILPDLAESYSNSGKVYTFKMRKGVTWSDGQPLTAKDYVYSIRRQIDPRTGNGYASFWDGVIVGAAEFSSADVKAPADQLDKLAQAVGVKAVDDGTFEVTGSDFYALIPGQFAFLAASTVAREDQVKKFTDAKGVSSWTDPNKTGAPVVCSGPYVLTAWKHNAQIDFVRNEKYWNAKAMRQKYITVKILPDLTKTTLPFENNDIDWQEIPPVQVERFKNDAKLKAQVFPYVNPFTRFLVPDTGHPPFDKLEVRKALILAVDRDRLVNQVGKKVHLVAHAHSAPGIFGYFDDDDNKLKNIQKYDPKAAMEALKGTTFEGGRNWPKIELSYNSSDTDIPAGTPDEMAREWKENLNMDVALTPLESKVWNSRRFAFDLQLLLYRWYSDYPDPHNNYYSTFSLHNKGNGARQSYNDPVFDDLTKKGAAEPDPKKRLDLYYQAETRIQSQFASMPLYWQVVNYAIKPWMTGLPKNKQGYVVPNNNIFFRAYDTVFVSDDSPHDAPK